MTKKIFLLAVFACCIFPEAQAWDPNKPFIYEMRIAFETDNWTNHYSTTTILSKSANSVAFQVVSGSTYAPTYQLVVTTQGYVGIATNTTNPAGIFTVGDGTVTVLSNGNVGIGTAAPGARLDVNGDIIDENMKSKTVIGTDSSGKLIDASLYGRLYLVAQNTPSAAASSTFSNLSPGKRYKLIVNLVQNTSTGQLYIQCNGDTGSNYKYGGIGAGYLGSSVFGSNSATSIRTSYTVDTSVGSYYSLEALVQTLPGNDKVVSVAGNSSFYSTAPQIDVGLFGGQYTGTSNFSSLTVAVTGGTFTGTITLYEMI